MMVGNLLEPVLLLQSTRDWIWSADVQRRITYSNVAVARILGYTHEEIVAISDLETLIHEEDRDLVRMTWELAIATGRGWDESVARWKAKDGSLRWLESTGGPLTDARGALIGFCGSSRDITLSIEQERRVVTTARLFRATFECAGVGIAHVDKDGACLRANPRLCEMLGYTEDEMRRLRIHDIIHPDDLAADEVQAARLFGGEVTSYSIDVRFIRKDGSIIWANVTRSKAGVSEEIADHAIAVVRDVSSERVAASALRESERDLRTLFESSDDAMLVIDPVTEIVHQANPKAAEIYGCSLDELIGSSIEAITADVPAGKHRIAELLAGTPVVRFETVQRRRDGSEIDLDVTGVVVEYRGRPAILSTNRDVTERNRLLQARRELEARLEQAERVESLGQVAASVAHEFNNTLLAISPVAEFLLQRYGDDPMIARLSQQLASAVQRGRRIATEILRFANPSDTSRERLDLRHWLSDVAEELRSVIGPIDLTTQAPPSLAMYADREQLHQVITNLVLNARDAMPEGGSIAITAREVVEADLTWIELAIHDSGPGIQPEVRSRMFEPLFTTKRKGTGLGLAICQQIVARHHGFIQVESEPGSGTVVRARFPADAMV